MTEPDDGADTTAETARYRANDLALGGMARPLAQLAGVWDVVQGGITAPRRHRTRSDLNLAGPAPT